MASADRPDSVPTNPERWELIARAWDPIGWDWYDKADADHQAKPTFFDDQKSRAKRVIAALSLAERAIDNVIVAGHTLRASLKEGHLPFTATLAEGVKYYTNEKGEVITALLGLWQACKRIAELEAAVGALEEIDVGGVLLEPTETP